MRDGKLKYLEDHPEEIGVSTETLLRKMTLIYLGRFENE